ncbi:MAG: ATP synthase F1 subunit epsilon [Candidatus Peregrinibacteria bacterium]
MTQQLYIHLDLVTLDKTLFKGKVKAITAPTKTGEVTILPMHAPLITALQAGELKLKVNEGEGIYDPEHIYVAISGGFMEVRPNSFVNIIADSALRIDDINEEEAMKVREHAEKVLKEHEEGRLRLSDQEFASAAAQLGKALAQLKVVKRKRK